MTNSSDNNGQLNDSKCRLNCIILSVYLFFILIGQLIVSDDTWCRPYLIHGTLMVLVISIVASPVLIKLFSKLSIDHNKRFERMPLWGLRMFFYGIPFVVLFLYYLGYYPGGLSNDFLAQYEQYYYNHFIDWHPVIQTLFAVCLPLKITGGWRGSIALFQIIEFSAVLGYSFDVVYKWAGKKYLIGTMLILLGNPYLYCFVLNLWKDVSFSMGVMLLIAYSLNVYFTKGKWLEKKSNMVVFIAVFVLTTLFRHNSILFTIPLLLALFFCVSRKRFIAVLIASAVVCALIKGPLYMALKVEDPGKRQVETLGLPLTVIGAAVQLAPEEQDEDVLEFAYRIAPQRVWEKYYTLGSFNSIKWMSATNIDVVNEYDPVDVIVMMMKCIKNSPNASLASLVTLTDGVYTITHPHYMDMKPTLIKNYFGFLKNGTDNILTDTFYAHRCFVEEYCPRLFLYYGVYLLVLVISVLSKSRLNKKEDWKKICFVVPLLAYVFGTSLLLTGFNDCPRYFFCIELLVPMLLVFFYRKEEVR